MAANHDIIEQLRDRSQWLTLIALRALAQGSGPGCIAGLVEHGPDCRADGLGVGGVVVEMYPRPEVRGLLGERRLVSGVVGMATIGRPWGKAALKVPCPAWVTTAEARGRIAPCGAYGTTSVKAVGRSNSSGSVAPAVTMTRTSS